MERWRALNCFAVCCYPWAIRCRVLFVTSPPHLTPPCLANLFVLTDQTLEKSILDAIVHTVVLDFVCCFNKLQQEICSYTEIQDQCNTA